MPTASLPSRIGWACLAALATLAAASAAAIPNRPADRNGPPLDARYVVTGVVTDQLPPPPAQFRMRVTAVNVDDGPAPGGVIDLRFLGEPPALPPPGATVQVWLLGGKDNLYLICPGSECRLIPSAAADPPGPAAGPPDRGELLRWVGAATVGMAAAFLVYTSARRPRRR